MPAETLQAHPPAAGRDQGAEVAEARGLEAWGSLLAKAGQGLAVKEVASGRYVHANAPLLGWFGRSLDEVVGHTDAELHDAATAAALRAADQAALQHGEPMAAEHRLGSDGRGHDLTVWRAVQAGRYLVSSWADASRQREQDQQLRAALGQIEQLQRANEAMRRELSDQGLRDSASGLYTRAHFEDQLRREVDLSSREHREFSIVFVEIDEAAAAAEPQTPPLPRRASDGARTGALQAALGRVLRGGTRAMDAACRLDERRFAVLLSGVGLATAHSRMESLRRRCATEIVVCDGEQLGFTVAMGVASFPHTAHTQAELVQACVSALREAQRRGGNHVALAAIRLGAPAALAVGAASVADAAAAQPLKA
jgi:GGDEF domain-containing protein